MTRVHYLQRTFVVLGALLCAGCGGDDGATTGGAAAAAPASPRAQKCAVIYKSDISACQQLDAEGKLLESGGVKAGTGRPPKKTSSGERPQSSGLDGSGGGGSAGGGCIFASREEYEAWSEHNPDAPPPDMTNCSF